MLPPRGNTAKGDQRLWVVNRVVRGGGTKLAELELLDFPTERFTATLDDLIVVAEFRDIIYPGLVSNGKVSHNGFRKPLANPRLNGLRSRLAPV